VVPQVSSPSVTKMMKVLLPPRSGLDLVRPVIPRPTVQNRYLMSLREFRMGVKLSARSPTALVRSTIAAGWRIAASVHPRSQDAAVGSAVEDLGIEIGIDVRDLGAAGGRAGGQGYQRLEASQGPVPLAPLRARSRTVTVVPSS
jgi:hypothetical protein